MPRPRSEEIPLEDMASSSQEVDDSGLPMQDPTSQSNSPSIGGSGQQVISDFIFPRRRGDFFIIMLVNLIVVVILEK
jgi:hypothetical protein